MQFSIASLFEIFIIIHDHVCATSGIPRIASMREQSGTPEAPFNGRCRTAPEKEVDSRVRISLTTRSGQICHWTTTSVEFMIRPETFLARFLSSLSSPVIVQHHDFLRISWAPQFCAADKKGNLSRAEMRIDTRECNRERGIYIRQLFCDGSYEA